MLFDPLVSQIQQRLISTFHPQQMFLFGSRVYGSPREDSDYDLLVVVEKRSGSRIDNMLKAREALFDLDVSADVFVYSEQEFEEWKNELNTVAEAAFVLGVELPLGQP
ncbi:MAG: nucleotidyltransferase domain-containing protein [Pseudobdellovibrionaceae bacterium]